MTIDRRTFLKTAASFAAVTGMGTGAHGELYEEGLRAKGMPAASADSVIVVWLPGGISCSEYFDARPLTPFQAGMKASEMLGVSPPIPTTLRIAACSPPQPAPPFRPRACPSPVPIRLHNGRSAPPVE